jgi:hypothetical protein
MGTPPRFWLSCAIAYLTIALLYWPSVRLAPLPLDDVGQLRELAELPFAHVLDYDRFGHLRPVKAALFWLLSRHLAWLPVCRCGLLAVVLATAALWQLLCTRLLQSRGWALAAAICWAVNPTTATALCWLSTANLTLSLFAILAYLWLAQRPSLLCALSAVACLLVAMLSHELAVLAPVLWLAHRRALAVPAASRPRIMPLMAAALAGIVVLITLHVTHAAPTIAYRSAAHSPWLLVLSSARYLLENLRLWLWLPGRFGVLLSDAPAEHVQASVLAWLGVVAACTAWWRVRPRDPIIAFGVLWTAVLLLPLVNLVPLGNTPVAMHYLVLPGAGLALLLTRVAQRLTDALRRWQRPRVAWLPALVLVMLSAAWLPEQQRALAAWADAQRLYETTVRNYPQNLEARVNLAAIYLDEKRYPEADALLVATLALAPNDVGLAANRFKLFFETRKLEAALDVFSRVLAPAMQPEDRLATGYQLSIALVRAEHFAQAEALVDRLLAEFPARPELLFSKQQLTKQR